MIHKPKQNSEQRRPGCIVGSTIAIVVVIMIIIGIVSVSIPPIIPPEDQTPTTTLNVGVQFTYNYPTRYTFWNTTTELLADPYVEYAAVHYSFNLTCEGRYFISTTRITPYVINPSTLKLQFYKVNMPTASDSFIDVAGMLSVTMNSTLITFDVLRIVGHSFILNDPNDYWSCELTIEALDYLTP